MGVIKLAVARTVTKQPPCDPNRNHTKDGPVSDYAISHTHIHSISSSNQGPATKRPSRGR